GRDSLPSAIRRPHRVRLQRRLRPPQAAHRQRVRKVRALDSRQIDTDAAAILPEATPSERPGSKDEQAFPPDKISRPQSPTLPKRFHATVGVDATRVGRDAGRIADEVISHLSGLVGSKVTVTLEIEAIIPGGAPDNVVRTVTENARTLKFMSQG